MSAGRRAALPQAGYAMPRRLFISEDECRVRLFPEDGGRPADIDLSVLPVPPQLQAWFAGAVAGVTGPGGTRRSLRSGLDTLSILKRFTRFLAGLDQPPQSPDQLTAAHVSGFILAGGAALHRDIPALRSILRFAQDPPSGFAARLAQASVPNTDMPAVSYSPDEYQRIIAAARSQLRAAATRIASGRTELAAWRAGLIGQAAEPARWEAARLLDHADRHGDVPRRGSSQTRTYSAQCAGGAPAIMSRLHLTYHEAVAGFVLLLTLTGHNHSTVAALTTAHSRPDGYAGGVPSALVEMVKPRRGSRRASMSQALQSGGEASAPDAGRIEVITAFGVYTALLDLAGPARARCGSDSLFAFYHYAGGSAGRGFRAGIPKAALACWAQHTWQASGQDNPDGGEPAGLRVSSRRLRLTWLEMNQKPVAHTETTLANQYLARNRGNLAEYQQVVAAALAGQVTAARSRPPIPALTPHDVELAATDPGAVADRYGLDEQRLAQLLAGRLDTVLAGCTGNLNSPHSRAGEPCTASFLLCLSCPNARATPAHLPVQVLTADMLTARREQMTPLDWAQRFADPATRLGDLLARYTSAAIGDARQAATAADRDLVERFLRRELDH